MKKSKLRALTAIVLTVALVVGIAAAAALANDGVPTVTYDHSQKNFVFTNASAFADGDGHQYPDLFGDRLKNLMPGDAVTQNIKVAAANTGSAAVDMYLRVESKGEGVSDAEALDYAELLHAEGVTLTVKKGQEVLGEGDPIKGVLLGSLANNASLDLNVSLNIPLTAGNALQGLRGAVAWVFTAHYIPKGEDGGGGIDIPETNPPLNPLPKLEKGDHFAYIIGRDDERVHPEAEITRAEVATIFFRLLTEESRNQYWSRSNAFSDVDANAWYNNAVSTLTNAGVINGKPGNRFDPGAPITRAEFAAIAIRFFGGEYHGPDQFSDISGHWASDEINRTYMNNLVKGYADGTFRPNNNIVRSEAIAIINRVLDRAPSAGHLLDDMITWPDNMDTSTWYYADVQEATNSHNYDQRYGEGANLYEIWTELLPVRDWAALEQKWSDANSSGSSGEVVSSSTNAVFEK